LTSKNVIIVVIDGGRADFAKKSSYFQNLNGVSFSQCITYGPHTIAAMHAVFSGSYGTRTGTNSYWSTYKFKKGEFRTLTEYLKDNNYYTCADLHSEIVSPRQGFDDFTIYDKNRDLSIRHCDILNKIKEKNESKTNFFLYLHYDKIHTEITEKVLKRYSNFSKEYFMDKENNKKRYDELFQNAEKYLKKIMQKIMELELHKNSIILIISDHGISVGEKFGERAYGAFCYDYTLKTFTYFLTPEFTKKEIKQQIRTVDLMPTILDILKINLDNEYSELDGTSLLPIILGEKIPENIAYAETGNPLEAKEPPKNPNTFCVRTSKWKLIFNEYDNSTELYDLEKDPFETKNLSGVGLESELVLLEKLRKIKSGQKII